MKKDPGDSGLRARAIDFVCELWQAQTWRNSWLGFPILQMPTDLMALQEIVVETRPRAVVETGTHRGGTAVFFASMFELMGQGRVISVDLHHDDAVRAAVAAHPLARRIDLVTGDSKSPEVAARIRALLGAQDRVMVFLDSDHSAAHVRGELEALHPLVGRGCYLVMGDTICRELSRIPGFESWREDNPAAALGEFLAAHPDFEVDRARERQLLTFFPGGYLRRR